MIKAFQPNHLGTVNIDVSSSNQRVAIVGAGKCKPIRVMNNGSATVWIEFGDSAVAATLAAALPIGPGGTEIFTGSINGVSSSDLYVAAIAAGSTGKIYFTPGDGI